MMEGQKVVKVFNYEEESKEKFDDLNEDLCDSMTKANMYANILMPCIMNIGNLGYVLVAVIGGILSVNGILTIGSIAAFLQYVKAFTNPLRSSITTNEFNCYGLSWSSEEYLN